MLVALVVSAMVNLQLFQDGSSYLFELLVTRSAIRHHRQSVLLIQMPVILADKSLTRLQVDSSYILQVSRLLFSLSYALIPFISLLLSWLVIRRKNEGLFIWAALIILFVNLVNFSWVSELLISLQLSLPLMLASFLMPRSKRFWALTIVLLPIIFFLHPLVVLPLVTTALGAAYVGYKKVEIRRTAWLSAIIFLTVAVLRGIFSLYIMSSYETSFLESSAMNSYLFVTSPENKLFLFISLTIGLISLMAKSIANSRSGMAIILPIIISIQALGVLLFLINLTFLPALILILTVIISIGFIIILPYRYYSHNSLPSNFTLVYISCMGLAATAGGVLISQYFSGSGEFPLKTGLALFTSMLIMGMASYDSTRDMSHLEINQRFRLVTALSIIFSLVIISKSLIWQSSIHKLEQSLVMTTEQCIEVVPEDFPWLERNPYNIINNWSLPSLALVVQDNLPRKLLLEKNDCKLYYESGMVQIDPWTNLPEKSIVPPIN